MRELNNYMNGKIYRIVCAESRKVYIGSTAEEDLNNRHIINIKVMVGNM